MLSRFIKYKYTFYIYISAETIIPITRYLLVKKYIERLFRSYRLNTIFICMTVMYGIVPVRAMNGLVRARAPPFDLVETVQF